MAVAKQDILDAIGNSGHLEGQRFSRSQRDLVRPDALGATDRPRLLIASATASAPCSRRLWREKHDVRNQLVARRRGLAAFEARDPAGLDGGRDSHDQDRVQGGRHRRLPHRAQSAAR